MKLYSVYAPLKVREVIRLLEKNGWHHVELIETTEYSGVPMAELPWCRARQEMMSDQEHIVPS